MAMFDKETTDKALQSIKSENDGLMFFSPTHLGGEIPEVYWIK